MKIYVVTKGDYSDYHIITATTDYELAKKIAANFGDDWNKANVEVFENAEIYLKPCWIVSFNKNGEIEYVERTTAEYAYCDINTLNQGGRSDGNYMYVSAETADVAVKIASEKYAQHRAKEAGIA